MARCAPPPPPASAPSSTPSCRVLLWCRIALSFLLVLLPASAFAPLPTSAGRQQQQLQRYHQHHPPLTAVTAQRGQHGGIDRVLVIGGGGREYTIVQALLRSKSVAHVFVAPGNAGTTSQMSPRVTSVSGLDGSDAVSVGSFAREEGIMLVVVGPEAPLVAGLADGLQEQGIACFGCSRLAAEIEGSKVWAKGFMDRQGIPTAAYRVFDDYREAASHVKQHSLPLVVKASGLAAGKGAMVAHSLDDALAALDDALNKRLFGDAGRAVVVEEFLEGDEVSLMGFCDGNRVACMPPARDYKRLKDGDQGPNTGGMGAVAPVIGLSPSQVSSMEAILQRAVQGMAREGRPFCGVLYGGFMLTATGPKVLEFNCRMGDPETQSVLSLLEFDLMEVMTSCVEGRLQPQQVQWATNRWAVTVVGASATYPGPSSRGAPPVIEGLDRDGSSEGWSVTHAGTTLLQPAAGGGGQVTATGGRVVSVTGVATGSVRSAILAAYRGLSSIRFEGMTCRRDVGEKMAANHGGPLRVAILGSTRGSSVRHLMPPPSPPPPYEVVLVVSDKEDAGLLGLAKEYGVPWLHVPSVSKEGKGEVEMMQALEAAGAELVLLNGYSKILSPAFVDRWWGRCLNMHPSLLPDYAGLFDRGVHEAVLREGRTVSGCTAHLVSEEVDAGPPVVQLSCPVEQGDDVDTLRAKVQALEARAWDDVITTYRDQLSKVVAILLSHPRKASSPL